MHDSFLVAHHTRLFAWDDWANREALASLRAMDAPPPKAHRTMAHIVGAEWLWFARIQGGVASVAVWPEIQLVELGTHLDGLSEAWAGLLDDLDDESIARTIAYRNTKGEDWTNTLGDILTHVVQHSAYHRGQIASEVRAAGGTPAYTDFIQAVRTGTVK